MTCILTSIIILSGELALFIDLYFCAVVVYFNLYRTYVSPKIEKNKKVPLTGL